MEYTNIKYELKYVNILQIRLWMSHAVILLKIAFANQEQEFNIQRSYYKNFYLHNFNYLNGKHNTKMKR